MTQFEKEKERVLSTTKERNEIYQEVDGFYVWWPNDKAGFMQAHHLRIIADELDRLNAPWIE